MPTLEPIVVNAPKEKKTYTYSENDIVDIVAQAIKQGKIEAGAGFEEVEFKIYFSDMSLETGLPTNEDILEKLDYIKNKIKQRKNITEYVEYPYEDRKAFSSLSFNSAVADNDILVDDVFPNGSYVIGFAYSNNALNSLYVLNAGENFIQTVIGIMANDPTKYISLKFRVEK